MLVQRSASRKRKLSSDTKTKFDIELPKINKTAFLLQDKEKQNNVSIPSFSERVNWVIDTIDYSQLSDKEINDEYNRLRKELHIINIEVAKQIEKIDMKVVKKTKITETDPVKILQIRDKQVENNNAIIERLRKEYGQLQKRVTTVSGGSKDDIQQEIEKTKGQVEKMKKKIKELKMKNKAIGDSIMNSDDLYEEIRRLENQREVNEKKKMKLQAKTDQVYDQISSSELKLEEINDNFLVAENFFEEYYGKNQINEQQRELQQKLRHAKHCLEIISRKNQTSNNSKQQKYHVALKELQNQMTKLDTLQQKTASIELQIIHCKKLLQELQEAFRKNEMKASEIFNQGPVFFTEFDADHGEKQTKTSQNESKSKLKKVNDKSFSKNCETQKKEVERNKTDTNEQLKKNSYSTNEQIKSQQAEKDKKFFNIESDRVNSSTNTRNERQRIQTSNGIDPEEEQDIIADLDEKFKYKTKNHMKSSRYNEKETEMGDEDIDDNIDEDQELMEFKSKITAEKFNRKSDEKANILKDIEKVKDHIGKSFDFTKNKETNYYDEEEEEIQQ